MITKLLRICLLIAPPFLCSPVFLFGQNYHVYFGDMHSHSLLSWDAKPGAKMPAQAYAYAKHVAQVDFLAISDHTNGLPQTNYEKIIAAAAPYENPDSQFVAIAGQELGSLGGTGYGHMNIFEAPTIAGNGLDNDEIRYNLNMAYQFIINHRVSGQFNHPSTENGNSNFANFDYYLLADPYMSSLEVINGTRSTNYERYYLLALQKGWHLGALGDQDNHGPNYGDLRSRDGDIYLTGVLADSLTKPKILEAIRGRRTYAFETNPPNDRIYLDAFTADGHWMGEIFDDADTRITLHVAAHAAPATNSRFRQAQIYRNGFLLAWKNLGASSFDWTAEDNNSTGAHYYFAKLVQEDGDLLWTSPIWVNSPGVAPPEPAPVPIRSLRQHFADGVAQSFGWANVKVQGIATAGTHFGSEGPGYLQDSTGGIAVFGGDFTKAVVISPTFAFEMEVTGAVSQFNGSLQLIPYAVKRVGVKPPMTPQIVTTAEIATNGESLEGLLVKVVRARIVSGNFPAAGDSATLIIDDDRGQCKVFVDRDTDIGGHPTPTGRIDIIGIANQYDFNPPYTEGYELLPRQMTDISLTTGVNDNEASALPRQFELFQNHPNPVSIHKATEIRFALPVDSEVRLEVFNLLGQRVALFREGKFLAGEYRVRWDGRDEAGKKVPAGIYFYTLHASRGSLQWQATQKMVVLP